MLILSATTDKIEAVTSSAATLDVHTSYADLNPIPVTSSSVVTPDRKNTAISSATTTDISGSPASSTTRNIKTVNIRNKDSALSCDVTIRFNQNSTIIELYKATLRPNDTLEYVEGIGWFVVPGAVSLLKNQSTTSQSLSTTDAYLTGSNVTIPSGSPVIGTRYLCIFDVAKTAGTGTLTVSLRVGTGGSTSDTARCSFALSVGTSVADTAVFTLIALFRSVGSGTSAVLQGSINMVNNLATTGFSGTTPIKALQVTSGGFDSTVANSIIGVSFNGSTAFAGTAQLVRAELA